MSRSSYISMTDDHPEQSDVCTIWTANRRPGSFSMQVWTLNQGICAREIELLAIKIGIQMMITHYSSYRYGYLNDR
jgi:hypothetical protein